MVLIPEADGEAFACLLKCLFLSNVGNADCLQKCWQSAIYSSIHAMAG
jgi:hypothetical protein